MRACSVSVILRPCTGVRLDCWPVDGLMVHIAGQGQTGFRVVDVWESEDAARRFGEQLMPVLQDVGITDQPELYPAHTFVSA